MKKKDLLFAAAAGTTLALCDCYRYIFYRSRSKLSRFIFERPGHDSRFYAARDCAAEALESRPSVMTSNFPDQSTATSEQRRAA